MKLQIDTEKKTIKIEEAVNLGAFYEVIKQLLPGWELYTLLPEVVTNWLNPIIIKPIYPDPWPLTPWQPYQPWYTYCDSQPGTFNLDIR